MELRYRPKFRRDLLHLKGKAEINERVYSIIKQIKKAGSIA